MSEQHPYDEQAMQRFGQLILAAYGEVEPKRGLDSDMIVWGGRIQTRAETDGYESAWAHVEAELRAGLGLPPKTPAHTESPLHVGPGPRTLVQVKAVVNATFAEFPSLWRVFSTDQSAREAMAELKLRVIWHLWLAGIPAAEQYNPSGALSDDKVDVIVNDDVPQKVGEWVCIDIASIGFADKATVPRFLLTDGANPSLSAGVPDGEETA